MANLTAPLSAPPACGEIGHAQFIIEFMNGECANERPEAKNQSQSKSKKTGGERVCPH